MTVGAGSCIETCDRAADEAVAFADAALGVAGHVVTDPMLRDLRYRVATGELTAEEAIRLGREHLDATRWPTVTPSQFRAWDDYFIPGTGVLRNKFTTPDTPYGEQIGRAHV